MSQYEVEPKPEGALARLPRIRTAGAQTVAIVLSVGMCTALNLLTFAFVYQAIFSHQGISENATQVLTGWGGGIVGVIGALVGYKAGESKQEDIASARAEVPAGYSLNPTPETPAVTITEPGVVNVAGDAAVTADLNDPTSASP